MPWLSYGLGLRETNFVNQGKQVDQPGQCPECPGLATGLVATIREDFSQNHLRPSYSGPIWANNLRARTKKRSYGYSGWVGWGGHPVGCGIGLYREDAITVKYIRPAHTHVNRKPLVNIFRKKKLREKIPGRKTMRLSLALRLLKRT